jgi:hypothetical protein
MKDESARFRIHPSSFRLHPSIKEALIQQILSAEPKVTTINLNYFEG